MPKKISWSQFIFLLTTIILVGAGCSKDNSAIENTQNKLSDYSPQTAVTEDKKESPLPATPQKEAQSNQDLKTYAAEMKVDTDKDGLTDFFENMEFFRSSPNKPDTDGDGHSDLEEFENCYDPNKPNTKLGGQNLNECEKLLGQMKQTAKKLAETSTEVNKTASNRNVTISKNVDARCMDAVRSYNGLIPSSFLDNGSYAIFFSRSLDACILYTRILDIKTFDRIFSVINLTTGKIIEKKIISAAELMQQFKKNIDGMSAEDERVVKTYRHPEDVVYHTLNSNTAIFAPAVIGI